MAVSVGRNRMALGLAGFLLGCGVVAVPVALLRSDLSGIGNGSDETLRTLAYLAILPAIAVLLLITIGTASSCANCRDSGTKCTSSTTPSLSSG